MRHWSASDGRMQFPQLVDTARKEPVLVFRHHRPVAAVISYERYLAFRETQIAALLSAATRIGGSAQARGMTPHILMTILHDIHAASHRS
jgi:prevent-host-death family protein